MTTVSSSKVTLPAKRWRAIGGLLISFLILLTLAAPAQARIVLRERYAGTYSDTYNECGFPVQVEGSFRGLIQIREGTGDVETAFFAYNNYGWEEVHSANGRAIIMRGNGMYTETRATNVEGSIFEFHAVEAGQPFALYDTDGNLVLRDRGVIRWTFLFDTLGDDEPGGIFIEGSVEFGGPHPSWDPDLFSVICALLA